MNEKKVVLVTAIGTMAGAMIVSELCRSGDFYVIGGDIYQKHMVATSKDVDAFYVFPPAIYDLEKYIAFVLDFCKTNKVEYYFAVIDEEISNLSDHREAFKEIGVKLCIPNRELVNICHFKNRFSEWITAEMPEIAIRTYHSVDEIGAEAFPLFVKPVEGRASIGCYKMDTMEQLTELVDIHEIGKSVVLQQYAEGNIITVDMIRNAETKQMMLVPRQELLRNGNGCGIAVQTLHDEQLEQICSRLAEKLELNGVVNAEFFCTKDGYRIIEVNPRFSAGSGYSSLAGANMAINAIEIADGKPCTFETLNLGKHYAKRYETYEM